MCNRIFLSYQFTEEQWRIITAPLVDSISVTIAGAGTGKTTTLIYKVLYHMLKNNINNNELLILTFTNKAVLNFIKIIELGIKKIKNEFHLQLRVPFVSTYHAYSRYIINKYAHLDNLEGYRFLNELASYKILHDIVSNDKTIYKYINNNIHKLTYDLLYLDKKLRYYDISIDSINKHNIEILQLKHSLKVTENLNMQLEMLKILEMFHQYKEDNKCFDYIDQILYAMKLNTQFPNIKKVENAQYKHIVLDEYQDASDMQIKMMKEFFVPYCNVHAIGDPRQSIYEWQGASPENINQFIDTFKSDTKNIYINQLTINWRSCYDVVNLSNTVYQQLRNIDNNVVPLKSSSESKGEIICKIFSNKIDQYNTIVELIQQHILNNNDKSIAILCRDNQSITNIYKILIQNNIVVNINNIQHILLFPEVQEIISILELISKSSEAYYKNVALIFLLTATRWKISLSDIALLKKQYDQYCKNNNKVYLYEYILYTRYHRATLPVFLQNIITALNAEISIYEQYSYLNIHSLVQNIVKDSGILHEMQIYNSNYFLTSKYIIDQFIKFILHLSKNHNNVLYLSEFLNIIHLMNTNSIAFENIYEENTYFNSTVTISTIHAAKGLEWDNVIIPDIIEKKFPSERLDSIWGYHQSGVPFTYSDDNYNATAQFDKLTPLQYRKKHLNNIKNANYNSELRLFYVGITRAKEKLFLLGCKNELNKIKKSSFVTILEENNYNVDYVESFSGDHISIKLNDNQLEKKNEIVYYNEKIAKNIINNIIQKNNKLVLANIIFNKKVRYYKNMYNIIDSIVNYDYNIDNMQKIVPEIKHINIKRNTYSSIKDDLYTPINALNSNSNKTLTNNPIYKIKYSNIQQCATYFRLFLDRYYINRDISLFQSSQWRTFINDDNMSEKLNMVISSFLKTKYALLNPIDRRLLIKSNTDHVYGEINTVFIIDGIYHAVLWHVNNSKTNDKQDKIITNIMKRIYNSNLCKVSHEFLYQTQ